MSHEIIQGHIKFRKHLFYSLKAHQEILIIQGFFFYGNTTAIVKKFISSNIYAKLSWELLQDMIYYILVSYDKHEANISVIERVCNI